MESTTPYIGYFLMFFTGFCLIAIPFVIIWYIVSIVKQKKHPENEIKKLKKPLSKFEQMICMSAGGGLIIIGGGVIVWFLYNIFIERLAQFNLLGIDSPDIEVRKFVVIKTFLIWGMVCWVGWKYLKAGYNGKRVDFRTKK